MERGEGLTNNEIKTSEDSFFSKYKYFIIGGGAIVLVAVIVIIIVASSGSKKPSEPDPGYKYEEKYFIWKDYNWTIITRLDRKSNPGPMYYSNKNILIPTLTSYPLLMKLTKEGTEPYGSQFCLRKTLGYGTYQFDLSQKVEDIADREKNGVFGFFLYKNDTYEIDIEIAKWGSLKENAANMDYVSQPHIENVTGLTFMLPKGHQNTRHSFTWAPDIIYWQAMDKDTGEIFFKWNTTENLREEDESMKLSFIYWITKGREPDNNESTIKVEDFKFTKYQN